MRGKLLSRLSFDAPAVAAAVVVVVTDAAVVVVTVARSKSSIC